MYIYIYVNIYMYIYVYIYMYIHMNYKCIFTARYKRGLLSKPAVDAEDWQPF